jgi:hypothetical protein
MKGILKRKKNGECAACLKNSVRMFVEEMYKMGRLEGSGVPVLYIYIYIYSKTCLKPTLY